MGNGIAHVFAQNGFEVSLVDISEERLKQGLATIERNLNRMVEKGAIEELQAKTAEFMERYQKGETLDELLPEAFAGSVVGAVR